LKFIDELVAHFVDNKHLFENMLDSIKALIANSKTLEVNIHSVKYRIKDPVHLRDKLIKKSLTSKQKGRLFSITKRNLFSKINDLVGFRIMHLHTKQIETIDAELKNIFSEQRWFLIEGPTAKTWDDESREYFENIGFSIDKSPNLYTSIHYVVKPNTNTSITCEIQVRTLMEEVWGEVDHSINYPNKSESLSCREQIKALARATSTSSRLVDSIFATHNDFESNKSPIVVNKKTFRKVNLKTASLKTRRRK
jgi:putative GTP pyrophosphokinase